MEDQPSSTSIVLPSRPPQATRDSYNREYEIYTNHFKVDLSKAPKRIYSWAIKSNPQIVYDNRKLRQEIINNARSSIIEILGQFCDTGFEIFSSQNKEDQKTFEIKTQANGEEYVLTFINKRIINLEEALKSDDLKERNKPIRFLNAQINQILRKLEYYQIGKLPKYFQMGKSSNIDGTQLSIYSGFQTTFSLYESGLFLKIDTANKLVNNSTLLQMIQQTYKNKHGDKYELRQHIKDMFIGKVVCATYGNYKTYPILDFDFETKIGDIKFEDSKGNEITMIQHYKKRYNIDIQDINQPLIKSEMKNIKKEMIPISLIPELVKLTGVPDDINDYQRRQVLTKCNKKPDVKVREYGQIIQQINATDIQQQFAHMGISLESKPYKLQAKKLHNPEITFKGGQVIKDDKVKQFNIQNEQYAKPKKDKLKWGMIFCSEGFNLNEFQSLFQQICQKQDFAIYPPVQKQINPGRNMSQDLKQCIQEMVKNSQGIEIVLLILPKRCKGEYPGIKWETISKYMVPTQWVNSDSLQKQPGSKVAKIVQQILAKTGGYAWEVKPGRMDGIYDQPFLLIGANVTKDKKVKSNSVISIVCNTNTRISSFYSYSEVQADGSDLINNLQSIIANCCKEYYKTEKRQPSRILYLREGIAPSGQQQFRDFEMKNLEKAFKLLDPNYNPELAVCLIDRKPTQKYFVDSNNRTLNPQFGTVIDSGMVNDTYEFKMIPQVVSENLGCAIPTQYTFLKNTTTMSQGAMLNLLYSQCFNYSNWTGPVRVPSVVQYATKLSHMNSNYIHTNIPESLANLLWYL